MRDKGREDHTAGSRVDNGELLAFFAAKPPHNGLSLNRPRNWARFWRRESSGL